MATSRPGAAERVRTHPRGGHGPWPELPCGALIRGATKSPRPLTKVRQRLCHRRNAVAGLARLHRRVRRRTDVLPRATTDLARTTPGIVLEDFSARGMIGNHHLARHSGDSGVRVPGHAAVQDLMVWVPTRDPTTPGSVDQDRLVPRHRAERHTVVRTGSAARNLASLVAGSSPETQDACGAEGSGRENCPVQPAAVKREPPRPKPAPVAVGNTGRGPTKTRRETPGLGHNTVCPGLAHGLTATSCDERLGRQPGIVGHAWTACVSEPYWRWPSG